MNIEQEIYNAYLDIVYGPKSPIHSYKPNSQSLLLEYLELCYYNSCDINTNPLHGAIWYEFIEYTKSLLNALPFNSITKLTSNYRFIREWNVQKSNQLSS